MKSEFFHIKSFVMFHTLLVSASTPVDLGYFIPPFKREKVGKRNICKGWFLGKSLSASETNVSSTRVQNDYSKLLYVDVAQTIFFKESFPQLMKKTVVFICWVSKAFVYTMAVAT